MGTVLQFFFAILHKTVVHKTAQNLGVDGFRARAFFWQKEEKKGEMEKGHGEARGRRRRLFAQTLFWDALLDALFVAFLGIISFLHVS